MASGVSVICGIAGRFDAYYSYCDIMTAPCTQVTAPVWYGEPQQDARFITGAGLTRTVASFLGVCASGISILVSSKALEKEVESWTEEQKVKAIAAAASTILEEEELQKVAIASDMRVKDFERELTDGYAYLHLEKNPHLVDALIKKPDPEPEPLPMLTVELPINLTEKPSEESSVEQIPAGIQLMLASDLKEIVDAGILNLVGAQGSGKTSTSCMLLRYRVWRSHKLIVINPHKKKAMYKGLEPHLLAGTKFYGTGVGDTQRAVSLLEGMDTVLKLIEKRYDEYQNLEEHQYEHFPVTILLEECAEYTGLLNILNRPAIKDVDDPGFKASKYLEAFWLKLFVASRKGNNFVIRTIQSDTNKANGTEGLSELIKSSGACTLTQFSVPDGGCIGGWRSTGKGEIKIPNQKHTNDDGNAVDAKPAIVPTYWDYCKLLKDITDFSDLIPTNVESIPSLEPIIENPEDLWHAAVQHLNKSLAADSQVKNVNFPTPSREVSDTENRLFTAETIVPSGEQQLNIPITYTPDSLTREQIRTKIQYHQHQGSSQTKIIEILWRVQKNRSGWKQAYKEFKELI